MLQFPHFSSSLGSKLCMAGSLRSLKTLTVIGSGLMGSGIAQVSAQSGYNVNLVDVSSESLEKAIKSMKKNLERVAKKKYKDDPEGGKTFVANSLASVHTFTDYTRPAKDSDLIIEAIVENVAIKQELFNPCVFASNTSSLPIKTVSSVVKRKDRTVGLHFFNPVPVMRLVEVIKTDETSEATAKLVKDFAKSLGKTTVVCRDTPGFIVNRLLVPYLSEAVRLYERGDASYHDIDVAMKLGAGHPMGPFELSDYIGLDTMKFITDGWHKSYPDEPLFKTSKMIDDLVSQGKLGRKSGEGFYVYDAMGNKVT